MSFIQNRNNLYKLTHLKPTLLYLTEDELQLHVHVHSYVATCTRICIYIAISPSLDFSYMYVHTYTYTSLTGGVSWCEKKRVNWRQVETASSGEKTRSRLQEPQPSKCPLHIWKYMCAHVYVHVHVHVYIVRPSIDHFSNDISLMRTPLLLGYMYIIMYNFELRESTLKNQLSDMI